MPEQRAPLKSLLMLIIYFNYQYCIFLHSYGTYAILSPELLGNFPSWYVVVEIVPLLLKYNKIIKDCQVVDLIKRLKHS